ncbi:MAG: sugar ABC transporter substrate-binding protein [Candidatus Izemoplasmatales bacterium]|nr:sugar ABC transporter substrate-binding protein [Candidatus Izemoplasmatales bacterium]
MSKVRVLLVLLVALFALTACGTSNDGITTVNFLNYSSNDGQEETLQAMVDAFELKNPNVDVVIETLGYSDYFTQLAIRVAGNQAPDVFELNIENFRAYADKGALAKIDTSTIDVSQIHPTTLTAFQVGNDQYGLPTKFSNVVMIYNKDLFDQAGISYPTNDWTWNDELVAAQAIRALGTDIYGVFRPIQTWEFYKTVAQNGGSMMNADQSAFTLNSTENAVALQMMVDRVNVTNVTPTTAQLGGMGDWDLFLSGRLGMIVTGIWAFSTFADQADFSWDIVVEPGIANKATHFFSDAVVVSNASEVKEAATLFAAFLSGSEEAALLRANANWDLPVALTDAVKTAYLAVTPPNNKEAVFESLNYLVMPPSLEKFSQVADDLQVYLDKAISGELTAQEALDQAQAFISNKYE